MHKSVSSRWEIEVDGHTLSDYRSAHRGAGDSDYKAFLPEACYECWKQAKEASELGLEAPTTPDEGLVPW